MELISILIFIGIIIILVFITRLFGAWMFRIDEVIRNQKEIVAYLKSINSKMKEKARIEGKKNPRR